MSHQIIIKDEDGSHYEPKGVAYAEEATRTRDSTSGVSIQYIRQPHEDEPKTEFVPGGRLVGTYTEDIFEESEQLETEQNL